MTSGVEREAACANCAHWTMVRPTEGWCRRRAPRSATRADMIAHWPQSHGDQWCGEHTPAKDERAPGMTCDACRFWRNAEEGLQPVDRGDRVSSWWQQAGHCCRHAPGPTSEPGPRAYWPATHRSDRCAEGAAMDTQNAGG